MMKRFILQSQWNWRTGGVALACVFLLAIFLVKPIGVSTQFVIFDGVVWNLFSEEIVTEQPKAKSGYASPNPYLNKSGGKYAKNIANPLNYSFIFVLAMMVGGFLASRLVSQKESKQNKRMPEVWVHRFGLTPGKRYVTTFLGGVFVLYGARLAGGCTSGHMMSGMMQTALSGYLFALAAFVAAVPIAILMYRKGGD